MSPDKLEANGTLQKMSKCISELSFQIYIVTSYKTKMSFNSAGIQFNLMFKTWAQNKHQNDVCNWSNTHQERIALFTDITIWNNQSRQTM